MEWIESIREAISYIEANIIKDLSIKEIADRVNISPDSFTKAFTRFHGVTSTAVRKEGALIKSFVVLKIKFSLEGGYIMDYKIVEKDAFKVVGVSKKFKYDSALIEVPLFWSNHIAQGKSRHICGMYGINIDEEMRGNEFEYIIADDYSKEKEEIGKHIVQTLN